MDKTDCFIPCICMGGNNIDVHVLDPDYVIHVQAVREFVILLWQSVTVSQSPPCQILLRVLGSIRADQHPLRVRNSL